MFGPRSSDVLFGAQVVGRGEAAEALQRISHGILPFFHWILPFYPWGYFGLKFGLSFSFGSWKLMILLRLKMPSNNNFYPSSLLSFVSFKENHIIQNLILATMHRMLYAQRHSASQGTTVESGV